MKPSNPTPRHPKRRHSTAGLRHPQHLDTAHREAGFETPPSRNRARGKIALVAFLGFAVLACVYLLIRTAVQDGIIRDMRTTNAPAIRDLSAQVETLRQGFLLLSEDANTVHSVLGLPSVDLALERRDPAEEEALRRQNWLAGAAYLAGAYRDSLSNDAMRTLSTDSRLSAFLAERSLHTSPGDGFSLLVQSGWMVFFKLDFDANSGQYSVETQTGERRLFRTFDAGLVTFLDDRIPVLRAHYDRLLELRAALDGFFHDPMFHPLFHVRGLTADRSVAVAGAYEMTVSDSQERTRMIVRLSTRDGSFEFNGLTYAGFAEFRDAFLRAVRNLDTEEAAGYLRVVDDLADFFSLPETRQSLEQQGLVFRTDPQDTAGYVVFTIEDAAGRAVGSYAVEKSSGVVYLRNAAHEQLSTVEGLEVLRNESQTQQQMALPDAIPTLELTDAGDRAEVILLLGANEVNTDTIMLVYADAVAGTVKLISIPRDLYFHGMKVNDLYRRFGPEQAMRDFSEIIGVRIEHYIYVDMMAFQRVVEILGGVDITLTEDLSDPTYGLTTGDTPTLSVRAGFQHLNPEETLAVVRSRHTTTDFSRSLRQQVVIEALKNRVLQLTSTSPALIVELVGTVLPYVRTDLEAYEILRLYSTFRNARFQSQNVLATWNILEHTFTNTYMLPDDTVLPDDFDLGLYILLPRGGDWNLIRWYVRNIIGG